MFPSAKEPGSANYRTPNHHNPTERLVMTSTQSNPNNIFWLARYAHNAAAPLIAKAKNAEPSLHLNIQINFTDGHPVFKENHLGIFVHWERPGMFQYCSLITTKGQVDQFITKLNQDTADLLAGNAVVPA